jgi:uncharacterized phage-associated protein
MVLMNDNRADQPSALDVAAAILRETGPIDHMKLEKLLYFAQAWHLAWYDEPLFREPVEAWKWGPMVEEVWQRYKVFGRDPIPAPVIGDPDVVRGRAADLVAVIADTYGRMASPQLSDLTHEDPLWQAAWQNRTAEDRGRQQIRAAALRDYYRAHGHFAGRIPKPVAVDDTKAKRVLEERDSRALAEIFEEALGVRVGQD